MIAKLLVVVHALLAVSFGKSIYWEDVKTQEFVAEELFSVEPQIFENNILQALNKLKEFLKNGDPENNVPPVDPFFVTHQGFDFYIEDTALKGHFQNVTIANFSNFQPEKVEFKLLPMHFRLDVFLDKIQADGRYKMVGRIFDEIAVNGTGKFTCELENVTLSLYLRPYNVNSTLQIRDMLFDYKIEKTKVMYTNEFESEDVQILDDKLATYILNRVQKDYLPLILDMGKLVFNHFLSGYTYQEILKILLEFLSK